MTKPLVVHIGIEASPLILERQALAGIDCNIESVALGHSGSVIEAIREADVVLNNHSAVTKGIFRQLERCRLMVRYGHGYDTIDVKAATDCGVMITNIAGSTTEEVANHALMLLLALAREVRRLDAATRSGRWNEVYSRTVGRRIVGETAGIVGFGFIGRAMARKCRSLGMNVLVYDPYVGDWWALEYGVELTGLERLLKASDYVSIHSPLSAATQHLIDEDALGLMKNDAYLINTARGPIVKEKALIHALQSGEIAGAGLDVFENEPLEPDNPLLGMENVVLTPHIAGSSEIGWEIIQRRAGEEAARVLNGGRPNVLVNPEVIGRLASSE